MPLKWTDTSDPIHARTTILLYGEPGAGKTYQATTLEVADDSRVMYLCGDPGHKTLTMSGRKFRMAQIVTFADVREAFAAARDMAAKKAIDWIIIDGFDEIGEIALKHFKATKKGSNGNPDTLGAYGDMADEMMQWAKAMRDLPCNVLFITHIDMMVDDQQRMLFGPSFPGKKTAERMVDWFDLVGCVRWRDVVTPEGTVATERGIQFGQSVDIRYRVKERGAGAVEAWEKPNLGDVLRKMNARIKKE